MPPRVARDRPDIAELERLGAGRLLAGEVELARRAATAVEPRSFAALVGWTPRGGGRRASRERLDALGAAAVELPRPAWLEPPTLIARRPVARPFRPLVETYGPAQYADLDPTPFAAVSFVLMFGMMFGDVGHGLLLAVFGLALRFARPRPARLAPPVLAVPVRGRLRRRRCSASPTASLSGRPGSCRALARSVDDPGPLLAVAIAVGAVLLALSYAFGTSTAGGRGRRSGARSRRPGSPDLRVPRRRARRRRLLPRRSPRLGRRRSRVVVGLVLLVTGFATRPGAVRSPSLQVGIELRRRPRSDRHRTSLSFARLARLRPRARGARRGRVARRRRHVGESPAGPRPLSCLPGRQRARVLAGAARRGDPGAAAGVLRALLSHLRGQGRAFLPWHIPLDDKEEP